MVPRPSRPTRCPTASCGWRRASARRSCGSAAAARSSSTASHSGSQYGSHSGVMSGRVGDVEAAHGAALGHALDLGHRRVDVVVRDAGQPGEAVRVRVAEVGEPVVVDAQHLDGGLGIVHAACWSPGRRRAPRPARRRGPGPSAAAPARSGGGCPSCRPRTARSRPCGRSGGSGPGTYSRPAEPMPLARPNVAPFFVTHIGPLGPCVTWGMRSLSAAEARLVKRSGGSQQRSRWQSAEITS